MAVAGVDARNGEMGSPTNRRCWVPWWPTWSASLRGGDRTVRLTYNTRGVRAIIGAAMAVAGGRPTDDLGEAHTQAGAPATADRAGMRPKLGGASGGVEVIEA